MNYPQVIEEEDYILVIYSKEEPEYCEQDDGVIIYYSKSGDVVKILIKKDDKHHILYL